MFSFYMVSTNVLGNTTGFTGSNLGAADMVQQRGLAMVNVTHNTDNRRALDLLFAHPGR